VRERALAGAADPLGLAVASYGEQARVHWHRGNVAAAVALYAQQAAHGSRSGRASLLFVARSLLAHPDLLDKALADPLSQRLLAAYFYTRSNEFAMDWPMAGTQPGADESIERKSPASLDVAGFLAAVQRHGLDHFDGADRMAAGAYRAGRYPLAAQLAARSTTPLAAWVRAKLALRAGDQAAALGEYAQAAKGFPVDESWNSDASYADAIGSPRCRVETERGVLALSRGEYLDAMARLYAGAKEYWPDAAYVAERVLTVDELKAFVDRNASVAPKPVRSESDGGLSIVPAAQIRALLARRLLRVGRDDEALAYFDEPAVRAKAAALVAARHAGKAWTRNARAEALFRQAQLTRENGMELLGTELAPDAAVFDGGFGMDAFPLAPKELLSAGEPARVSASAAVPDARFHYRYVAADLAEQATALVPARSQAYAALMCQATSWVIDTDTKRATGLYRRYLHEGAWVGWGKDFGRTCPAPDFAAARWVPWKQRYRSVRHWAKRGWPFALCGLGLAIVVLAMARRRRDAE
jgi:tetratricopeptide (TPR) repeat protein